MLAWTLNSCEVGEPFPDNFFYGVCEPNPVGLFESWDIALMKLFSAEYSIFIKLAPCFSKNSFEFYQVWIVLKAHNMALYK